MRFSSRHFRVATLCYLFNGYNTNQSYIFLVTHSIKPNTRFHKVGQVTFEDGTCRQTDRQDSPSIPLFYKKKSILSCSLKNLRLGVFCHSVKGFSYWNFIGIHNASRKCSFVPSTFSFKIVVINHLVFSTVLKGVMSTANRYYYLLPPHVIHSYNARYFPSVTKQSSPHFPSKNIRYFTFL